MRKLAINLMAFGVSAMGFAQYSYPYLGTNLVAPGALNSNFDYLHKVQNQLTPMQVKYLENVVSYWDVSNLKEFRKVGKEPLEVSFKSQLGSITASYDEQGGILSAQERFKNIALPNKLSHSIFKDYPNWYITKTEYSLLYVKGRQPVTRFRVQIRKDNQKKWIKIQPSGKIT